MLTPVRLFCLCKALILDPVQEMQVGEAQAQAQVKGRCIWRLVEALSVERVFPEGVVVQNIADSIQSLLLFLIVDVDASDCSDDPLHVLLLKLLIPALLDRVVCLSLLCFLLTGGVCD